MKHKRAFWVAVALICLIGVGIGFEMAGVSVGAILSWAVLGAMLGFGLGTFVFWAFCTWYLISFWIKLGKPHTPKETKEIVDSVTSLRQ